MTRGAGGELLTRLYQSSIFQALNSRPLLPCGLRVAVTHSGLLQHSHSAFITYGVHACPHNCTYCTHIHTYTYKRHTHKEVTVIKVPYHILIQPLPSDSAVLLSVRFSNVSKERLNCKIKLVFIKKQTRHILLLSLAQFSKAVPLQQKSSS